MHIEFFVEEESAETALRALVPKILGTSVTFRVHTHQDKLDLLAALPRRLRGYAGWIPEDWRIVVLIDEDREDCTTLKQKLERAAADAGLKTKSAARGGQRFYVVNRIAIEELEAWFFGDIEALVAAYPRVPVGLDRKARYRNPDAIAGGTWEALERVLQRAGYYPGGLPKKEAAGLIAAHMDPSRNRSRSFQVFRDALIALASP